MNIALTGCAGFIGSHVCEQLLQRGDTVVGVDNFDPNYPRKIKEAALADSKTHAEFQFTELDLRDEEAVRDWWNKTQASTPIDVLVHLAAKVGVRPSVDDPIAYQRANTLATNHLLECLASGPAPRPKFILASSSSVYGNNKKTPFSEADAVDHPISPYAQTKKACELLTHVYHHLHGIDAYCLRFFTVYGPRQRPDLAIHKFTQRILSGEAIELFGSEESSRDYTYVDDIVAGVLSATDRCEGYEVINLGSRNPISLGRMVQTVEQACGVPAKITRVPAQPGDVDRTFADVSKAERLLDYSPSVTFEEGVKRFVDWFSCRD